MTNNKIGQTNIIEGHIRTLEDIEYANKMAEARKEKPRRIRVPPVPTHFKGKPVSALTPSERAEFYISMQSPSTQAVLLRDPKDDAAAWDRPILNWKAVPDADLSTPEGRDKAVGKRAVTPEEAILVERTRRAAKNQDGDSDKTVSPESKQRAIDAFVYSQPAVLTPEEKKRVTKIEPMVSTLFEPQAETPRKQSLFRKLMDYFKGKPLGPDQPQAKARLKETKARGGGIDFFYEE